MNELTDKQLTELEQACQELNRLLGNDAKVTPEQLLHHFSGEHEIPELYDPELGITQLRERILATQAAPLSSAKLAANAVSAFWKWARDGFSLADPGMQQSRLDVCRQCPHYVDPPDTPLYKAVNAGKICALCGCDLAKKIPIASSSCPDKDFSGNGNGRWKA